MISKCTDDAQDGPLGRLVESECNSPDSIIALSKLRE